MVDSADDSTSPKTPPDGAGAGGDAPAVNRAPDLPRSPAPPDGGFALARSTPVTEPGFPAPDSGDWLREHPTSVMLPWVICTAIPSELAIVRRALGNPKLVRHPEWPDFYIATVGEHIVYLGATGMGRDASALLTDQLMPQPIAGALMVGFAGGLDPQRPTGWICLADDVLSTRRPRPIRSSRALLDHAKATIKSTGLPGGPGRVLTVDDVIHDPGAKATLFKRYGGDVVDMETAGVAVAARATGSRWIAIRVVFDTSDETLPRVQSLAEASGLRLVWELARLLLTQPWVLFALPGLAARARIAGRNLETFIRAWFETMPRQKVEMPEPGVEPLPWEASPDLPDPLEF